ncbi:hypothetical protein [Limobrevibacterium gyesilva]|uniref:Uncharacterized protein n=1 Tax=Limobrevibacterium gyesilva TaxID=2991712 RepID=A0AA42CFU9_9PROT|nr:hypothetical protein [Limobrevibacterium gyesilva]MCW3477483.1 hypothetical protein [Limobrevibacterium gyesilva]
MDTSTVTGLFTLGGVVAGGLFGVIAKIIADVNQTNRDRETRREQQRSDFQRWQREQFMLLMINCAKSANLYVSKRIADGGDDVAAQNDPDIRQASAELQGWLIALAIVCPDAASDDYRRLCENLDKAMWQAVPKIQPVWEIRQLLVKLAARFSESSFPSITGA